MSHYFRFVLGMVFVIALHSPAIAAPQYEVTNLTEAFYADFDYAIFDYETSIDSIEICSMNDVGQFVGKINMVDGIKDIFVWEPGSAPSLAGINLTNGYLGSFGGITNSGKVAGTVWNSDTLKMQTYAWDWDTVTHTFEYTETNANSTLRIKGMNEYGSIAATKNIDNVDAAIAFGGNINEEIGFPETFGLVQFVENTYSRSAAINDNDVVVGYYGVAGQEPDTYHRAFMWRQGSQDAERIDLGNFIATDINNSEQVVGWGTKILGIEYLDEGNFIYNVEYYGVFWDDGELYEIGTLDGRNTYLEHLNDSGQAVGYANIPHGAVAVYWDIESGLLDLNDLTPEDCPWYLYYTDTINNKGDILVRGNLVGEEVDLFNSDTFFLLTPTTVPEPRVMILILGLLISGFGLYCQKCLVYSKP